MAHKMLSVVSKQSNTLLLKTTAKTIVKTTQIVINKISYKFHFKGKILLIFSFISNPLFLKKVALFAVLKLKHTNKTTFKL